jgi:peptide/nickel transport system substrate-binding protein
MVGCKIMDGLVTVSQDRSQVKPALAASWDISPDQLTYTFHLRQNVLWHDGQPFTSEDVKWSFENLNKLHPVGRFSFDEVRSIDAPDANTVVLHLKEPFAPLLSTLTCPDGGAISPKHVVAAGVDPKTDKTLNQAPVGTGPFVFKEWIPGDRIVMTRNPKYWQPDLPYLDQVVAKVIPDNTTMVQALRAGEINHIYDVYTTRDDVVRLQSQNDPNVAILKSADAPTFDPLLLNVRRGPLSKVEVRRALLQGLDRDLILKNVFKGLAVIETNMIDSRLAVAAAPEVDLQKLYPFDVAAANKLLDQAGYPRAADGTRFPLRLSYETGRAEFKDAAEIIRNNWQALGVKVQPEPLERTVMLDRVFAKRDFDVTIQGYASRGDPALGVARAYMCESDQNPPTFGNPSGYCRKDVDELFQQAARTADFDKRREVYRQLQKILADDLPLISMIGEEKVALADKQFDLSGPTSTAFTASSWETVHKLR